MEYGLGTFKEALLKHDTVSFILTKGNHDIIDYAQHHLPHFKIVKELWLHEKNRFFPSVTIAVKSGGD
ncbi:hypothetical protein QW060_25735 [Myroides ceti]|uniref:Uncharacterized protein n=1 Tax=Paenimyroides ceti TaxID=395087 RepID=A0ABT8D0A4_9FLAO|nr:hypothetical protein [Paenimyroides ceti]MDN3710255.1 hypothetical protein [Paenimyroides ceti]